MVAAVDAEKCTGCGLCVEVCPAKAITVDKVASIASDRCTGCGNCVTECPQEAIALRKA
ncbi:MAG: 4Fe-4S binding protein [Planctomycetes bacterium]|nr:4Fe-4S binding protein [Planctomycetota bacterium]